MVIMAEGMAYKELQDQTIECRQPEAIKVY